MKFPTDINKTVRFNNFKTSYLQSINENTYIHKNSKELKLFARKS